MNELQTALEAIHDPPEIYFSEGTAHEWQTWRRSLHAFARLLLFR